MERVREKGSCWIFPPLGDVHSGQGQVFSLARIGKLGIVGREAALTCPEACCWQVALRHREVRPYGCHSSKKVWDVGACIRQSDIGIQSRQCLAVFATGLLQTRQRDIAFRDHIGLRRLCCSYQFQAAREMP